MKSTSASTVVASVLRNSITIASFKDYELEASLNNVLKEISRVIWSETPGQRNDRLSKVPFVSPDDAL